MIEFKLARSREELQACFDVMKILRPHLTIESFLTIYESAHKNEGYEIVGYKEDGATLAVMGYRVLHDMIRGKHVYIDDLVTIASARSSGIGAKFLDYAFDFAKKNHCTAVRLCTGIENVSGIKFYEKNGYRKSAFAYTKKIM